MPFAIIFPFNSLFEIPRVDPFMNELEAIYTFNSLFEILVEEYKKHSNPGTFNSLFEIQKAWMELKADS